MRPDVCPISRRGLGDDGAIWEPQVQRAARRSVHGAPTGGSYHLWPAPDATTIVAPDASAMPAREIRNLSISAPVPTTCCPRPTRRRQRESPRPRHMHGRGCTSSLVDLLVTK